MLATGLVLALLAGRGLQRRRGPAAVGRPALDHHAAATTTSSTTPRRPRAPKDGYCKAKARPRSPAPGHRHQPPLPGLVHPRAGRGRPSLGQLPPRLLCDGRPARPGLSPLEPMSQTPELSAESSRQQRQDFEAWNGWSCVSPTELFRETRCVHHGGQRHGELLTCRWTRAPGRRRTGAVDGRRRDHERLVVATLDAADGSLAADRARSACVGLDGRRRRASTLLAALARACWLVGLPASRATPIWTMAATTRRRRGWAGVGDGAPVQPAAGWVPVLEPVRRGR